MHKFLTISTEAALFQYLSEKILSFLRWAASILSFKSTSPEKSSTEKVISDFGTGRDWQEQGVFIPTPDADVCLERIDFWTHYFKSKGEHEMCYCTIYGLDHTRKNNPKRVLAAACRQADREYNNILDVRCTDKPLT